MSETEDYTGLGGVAGTPDGCAGARGTWTSWESGQRGISLCSMGNEKSCSQGGITSGTTAGWGSTIWKAALQTIPGDWGVLVKREPAMHPGGKGGQEHPGLHQQVLRRGREKWFFPSTQCGEATFGVLCWQLGSPVQKRREHTRASRAKGHKNY